MSQPNAASHVMGELCVAGDGACVRGDLHALSTIVLQLADHVGEPLHCELVALADVCTSAPDRAAALWDSIKDRLYPVANG